MRRHFSENAPKPTKITHNKKKKTHRGTLAVVVFNPTTPPFCVSHADDDARFTMCVCGIHMTAANHGGPTHTHTLKRSAGRERERDNKKTPTQKCVLCLAFFARFAMGNLMLFGCADGGSGLRACWSVCCNMSHTWLASIEPSEQQQAPRIFRPSVPGGGHLNKHTIMQ